MRIIGTPSESIVVLKEFFACRLRSFAADQPLMTILSRDRSSARETAARNALLSSACLPRLRAHRYVANYIGRELDLAHRRRELHSKDSGFLTFSRARGKTFVR